jgi:hypothetical protein
VPGSPLPLARDSASAGKDTTPDKVPVDEFRLILPTCMGGADIEYYVGDIRHRTLGVLNTIIGENFVGIRSDTLSVADPGPFDTDPDPDPAFHFDADWDPDPVVQFDPTVWYGYGSGSSPFQRGNGMYLKRYWYFLYIFT